MPCRFRDNPLFMRRLAAPRLPLNMASSAGRPAPYASRSVASARRAGPASGGGAWPAAAVRVRRDRGRGRVGAAGRSRAPDTGPRHSPSCHSEPTVPNRNISSGADRSVDHPLAHIRSLSRQLPHLVPCNTTR